MNVTTPEPIPLISLDEDTIQFGPGFTAAIYFGAEYGISGNPPENMYGC